MGPTVDTNTYQGIYISLFLLLITKFGRTMVPRNSKKVRIWNEKRLVGWDFCMDIKTRTFFFFYLS